MITDVKIIGGTDKQQQYARDIRERIFKYNLNETFLKGFDHLKEDIIKYSTGDTYKDKIIYTLEYAVLHKTDYRFWINNNHPYTVCKMILKDLKSDYIYNNKKGDYLLPQITGRGAKVAKNYRKQLIALEVDKEYIESLDAIQFNTLYNKAVFYASEEDKKNMTPKLIECAEKIKINFIENETIPDIWIINYYDNFRYLLSGRKLSKNTNPKILNRAKKKQHNLAKNQ